MERKLPLLEIAILAWSLVILIALLIPSIGKVRPEPLTAAQQNGLRAAFLFGLAAFPVAVIATVAWLARALLARFRRPRPAAAGGGSPVGRPGRLNAVCSLGASEFV